MGRCPRQVQEKQRTAPTSTASLVSVPCPHTVRARMPGHYSTGFGFASMSGVYHACDISTVLFVRALPDQVFVCRCCGPWPDLLRQHLCRRSATTSPTDAGQRYQATYRGRLNHAARASRYRTQQRRDASGFTSRCLGMVWCRWTQGLLAATEREQPAAVRDVVMRSQVPVLGPVAVHWCGERCSPLLRNDFPALRLRVFEP